MLTTKANRVNNYGSLTQCFRGIEGCRVQICRLASSGSLFRVTDHGTIRHLGLLLVFSIN